MHRFTASISFSSAGRRSGRCRASGCRRSRTRRRVGVGDAEPAAGTGVPERFGPEARHARGGQLVAEPEADVRPGRPALDEGLDVVGSRPGHQVQGVARSTSRTPSTGPSSAAYIPASARASVIAPDRGSFGGVVLANLLRVRRSPGPSAGSPEERRSQRRVRARLVVPRVPGSIGLRPLPPSGHDPRDQLGRQAHPHVQPERLGDQARARAGRSIVPVARRTISSSSVP